jgi:hypothetical protein
MRIENATQMGYEHCNMGPRMYAALFSGVLY